MVKTIVIYFGVLKGKGWRLRVVNRKLSIFIKDTGHCFRLFPPVLKGR